MKKSIIAIIFLAQAMLSFAQEQSEAITLESPYNTVYSHLYYLQADSYEPEKSALTIYGKEGKEAEQIAVKIKQILDSKNLYVIISKLPKDSLYADSTENGIYYLFPNQLPEINLKRIDSKWYYSEETIEVVPALHRELYPFGSAILLDYFPRMGTGRFLGIMVWQYLGFGIFILATFLLYFLFSKLIDLILIGLAKTNLGDEHVDKDSLHKIGKFISFIILIYLFTLFLPVLQFPIHVSRYLLLILDIFKYTFFVFLGLRIFDFVMIYLNKLASKTETQMDDQLLLILKRGVQIGIVIFGLITILNRVGINVTALIAGVSIGGLAIALAAQDSVKNLIGAFMVFLDRPFDVGDYIIAGSVQGVVQEVGFRSTRLQASDTSIITMPNGKIADEVINNLGRRVYRRYRTQLGIKYDTSPEMIEMFVKGIEDILKLHPDTLDEKTEVHLNEFAASSLNIFIQTFFTVDSWSAEMREKQKIMIHIINLAQILGVEFAFPSQSVYIEKESSLSEGKSKDKLEREISEFMDNYKMKINFEK